MNSWSRDKRYLREVGRVTGDKVWSDQEWSQREAGAKFGMNCLCCVGWEVLTSYIPLLYTSTYVYIPLLVREPLSNTFSTVANDLWAQLRSRTPHVSHTNSPHYVPPLMYLHYLREGDLKIQYLVTKRATSNTDSSLSTSIISSSNIQWKSMKTATVSCILKYAAVEAL